MQFKSTDAIDHLRATLSNAWDSGSKVYLVSLGNHSKRDYEKLAKSFHSRVVTVRSIFGGLLRAISFVMPGSFIGALEVNRGDNWPDTIIDLAGHGYVALIVGNGPDLEETIINSVQAYSLSGGMAGFFKPFSPKFKIVILNAEVPGEVEIETGISSNQRN